MKTKHFLQPDDIACGPACLKMVLSYFGQEIPFKKISETSKYQENDGLENNELVELLGSFGLTTDVRSGLSWGEFSRLNIKENMIIVSWMKDGYLGHFSIVDEVAKDSITIIDPEDPKPVKMTRVKFLRLWLDYYKDVWYPQKNSDIQLRWMVVVSKNKKPLE